MRFDDRRFEALESRLRFLESCCEQFARMALDTGSPWIFLGLRYDGVGIEAVPVGVRLLVLGVEITVPVADLSDDMRSRIEAVHYDLRRVRDV